MKKILRILFVFAFTNTINAQVYLKEDFKGDISDWTTLDRDGDGNNWYQIKTERVPAPFSDEPNAMASDSYYKGNLDPNNILFSPEIDLTAATGSVFVNWHAYSYNKYLPDEYHKVVITTEPTAAGVDAGEVIYDGILSSSDEYIVFNREMPNSAGRKVYLAFIHHNSASKYGMLIDGITVYDQTYNDLGMSGLSSPVDNANCSFTDSETVTIQVTNFGANAVSNFDVSYAVNGGVPVTETITELIPPWATYTYTFDTKADMSAAGDNTIDINVNFPDDYDNSDNSQSFILGGNVFTVHLRTTDSRRHYWQLSDNETGEVLASYSRYPPNTEITETVCIRSDKCYTFDFHGFFTSGGYLELLINGNRIYGDTEGNGLSRTSLPAIGFNCSQNNMSATSVNIQRYMPLGDIPIFFDARNIGQNSVTSFEASYSVDGGVPVTQIFRVDMFSGDAAEFSFDTPFRITEIAAHDIAIEITKVNTVDDSDPSDNSLDHRLIALSQIPPHSILIEEGTGTWCGWCTLGTVGIDYMSDTYADAITIAAHNRDPMDFGDYEDDLLDQVVAYGFPFAGIDRTIKETPYIASLESAYRKLKGVNAPVEVSISAKYTGNDNIDIEVSADVYAAVLDGDHRFSVILTEDGLSGTGDRWAQANYYSGGGEGPMGGFENLPDPVPADQMVYDHVARQILGGFSGQANSFPATAFAGGKHSFTFNAALTAENDFRNMHAVGILIDNLTGRVLNSASVRIEDVSSTEDVIAHNIARVFPNPFSSTADIELGLEGTQHVEMTVLNSLGQRVAQRDYGMLTGKTILPFNSGNLQNGFYYFRIKIDDESVTKKVMLNKEN